MQIPKDGTLVYDHPLATLWFDDEGILHKISKNEPRTKDKVEDLYSYIRILTNGKKVCALLEVSRESISNKDVIQYLKKEIPITFSALALIASTPLGQITVTLITVLTPTHIPVKVFNDESQAKQWLSDYAKSY